MTGRPPRLPAVAARLRRPLHELTQQRMVARWGFDLNGADAPERAEATLSAAPDDADRLLLAAAVRSSRGDDAGALDASRRAVALAPESSRAHTTLATLLARAGDDAGAAVHAARAAEIDPDDPVALYNRALSEWTAGERREARADLARVAGLIGVPATPWWRRWGGG